MRVRVAEYRHKRGRCAFREILVAEERRARAGGARREAAILECKLTIFCLLIPREIYLRIISFFRVLDTESLEPKNEFYTN